MTPTQTILTQDLNFQIKELILLKLALLYKNLPIHQLHILVF